MKTYNVVVNRHNTGNILVCYNANTFFLPSMAFSSDIPTKDVTADVLKSRFGIEMTGSFDFNVLQTTVSIYGIVNLIPIRNIKIVEIDKSIVGDFLDHELFDKTALLQANLSIYPSSIIDESDLERYCAKHNCKILRGATPRGMEFERILTNCPKPQVEVTQFEAAIVEMVNGPFSLDITVTKGSQQFTTTLNRIES